MGLVVAAVSLGGLSSPLCGKLVVHAVTLAALRKAHLAHPNLKTDELVELVTECLDLEDLEEL